MATPNPHAVGRLLVALGLTAAAASIYGQHVHPNPDHKLPVVVDGAREPDKLSDDVAYAHLIALVAIPDTPNDDEVRRRDTLLDPVKLEPPDRAALLDSMRGVYAQLDFLSREQKRLSSTPDLHSQRLEDLRLRKTATYSAAISRLNARLSPKGRKHLRAYLQTEVKPRIVIYGDPAQ